MLIERVLRKGHHITKNYRSHWLEKVANAHLRH